MQSSILNRQWRKLKLGVCPASFNVPPCTMSGTSCMTLPPKVISPSNALTRHAPSFHKMPPLYVKLLFSSTQIATKSPLAEIPFTVPPPESAPANTPPRTSSVPSTTRLPAASSTAAFDATRTVRPAGTRMVPEMSATPEREKSVCASKTPPSTRTLPMSRSTKYGPVHV